LKLVSFFFFFFFFFFFLSAKLPTVFRRILRPGVDSADVAAAADDAAAAAARVVAAPAAVMCSDGDDGDIAGAEASSLNELRVCKDRKQ
jgi:hypothetical protein